MAKKQKEFDAVLVSPKFSSNELGNRIIKDEIVKRNPKYAEHMNDYRAIGVTRCSQVIFFIPKFSKEEQTNSWEAFWPWSKNDEGFDGKKFTWEKIENGLYGGTKIKE